MMIRKFSKNLSNHRIEFSNKFTEKDKEKINHILLEIKYGVDLNKRTSRHQQHKLSKDPLVANFGIYHIHISKTKLRGEDELLTFFDTGSVLYLITICNHKQLKNYLFLVEIMFENFPFLFLELKGLLAPLKENRFNGFDHKQLNSCGFSTIFYNNEKCYLVNKPWIMTKNCSCYSLKGETK